MPKLRLTKQDSTGCKSITSFINSKSEDDGEPVQKKERCSHPYQRNDSRHVVPGWFLEFTWLTQKEGLLYCSMCLKENFSNAFTKGKSTQSRPKKDDLKKHAETKDHK